MSHTHRFSVFADYFQFVLMDEKSDDDFSTLWDEQALDRMLAVGRYALCPGTLRNVDVEVELNIARTTPTLDFTAFDHVVEASVELPSGNLVVMGCTGSLPDVPRIALTPGNYQALFLASGIQSIKTEWEPANDLYSVYLWPGPPIQPKLIKHWQRPPA